MNRLPPHNEPLLNDLSLSDLSDYDVEAGYERFLEATASTPTTAEGAAPAASGPAAGRTVCGCAGGRS